MKPMSMIIGAIIVILLLAAGLTALNQFRGGSYTDTFNNTTGGGVTTGNVVLSQALLDDATANTVVTSNNTADAPVPTAYVTATKTLTVGGLNAADVRRLTVVYTYNQLGSYWAADIASRSLPVLLVLGVFGIIVGAVIVATRKD